MDLGIGFAIVAALVWGVYIFYLKQAFEGYSASTLTVLINGCALVWYVPVLGRSLGVAGTLDALSAFALPQLGVLALTAVTIGAANVAFLRALSIGFGVVTLGTLLAGVLDQVLQFRIQVGLLVESALVTVGFAVIVYSLYTE